MSGGWVAGSVRSQAIARRRLGTAGARGLAAAGSLAEAVEALAGSPYGGQVRADDGLADAQRGVAAGLLWNLRVLAGWLPGHGVGMLRLLAGWFEIANVDEHLQALASPVPARHPHQDRPAEPPYRLGALATSWPRLAAAGSVAGLRATLATSPWGDPGGAGSRDIQLGMRLAWANRVATQVPAARAWAAGAAALLVAREHLAGRRRLPGPAEALAARLLGRRWPAASSLAELAAALPAPARWVLDGVADPADLWAAEVRWWRRLRTDGARLLAAGGFGPGPIVGAVALLAADAWLVRGALEVAARGGAPALEVFDELA